MLKLNNENYHSQEANRDYMSVSQYKSFLECEAETMAEINGEWVRPSSEALLVGSYVHAWNEGTIEQFKETHPEMFSSKGPTKGQLKANFLFANQMIATLENDPFCMYVLEGQKEVIMTAEMFGATWKIMMDSYQPEGKRRRITDLKTTKSITDLVWSPLVWEKVSFLEAYAYPLQLAVYNKVEQMVTGSSDYAEPLIVAISKETPPDKAIISLDDSQRIKAELHEVSLNMPRIIAVKSGLEKPNRCERCAYCRSTKKIDKVIYYRDLMKD